MFPHETTCHGLKPLQRDVIRCRFSRRNSHSSRPCPLARCAAARALTHYPVLRNLSVVQTTTVLVGWVDKEIRHLPLIADNAAHGWSNDRSQKRGCEKPL